MSAGDPKEGDVIDGRYRLQKEIGRGGHGLVFGALDAQTNVRVALKILNQDVSDDPEYAVRLWREAQSLRALWGSSVVHVYGFGTDQDSGFIYMVMEFLEGETLSRHLTNLELFGHRISAFHLLEVLDPVARALHLAHGLGIVHRDVKPANIHVLFPETGGGTRLMDFGLAKIHGASQLTQAGMVAGSPSYIAPELWRDKPFDHRIDVYSLAAVIFRALAGQPPFRGKSVMDLLVAATTGPRPKLSPLRPDLHPSIDVWVETALAIEADRRFSYVSTMWNELIEIIKRGKGPSALRASTTFSVPPSSL